MPMLTRALPAAALFCALAMPTAHAQQPGEQDMKPMMQKSSEHMMSMEMTGKPDVDFAMMMREHHRGGVQMAQWELAHGKDPKMKAMARKIIATQKKEIAEFDRYLASKGHRAQ